MRVSVIGSGYVGLVAGACLSNTGNTVTLVDINPEKVAMLERGEIPIFEPGLGEIVSANTKAKRLFFTTDTASAVADAQVVYLAVGTPSAPDGSVDMSQIDSAAAAIGKGLRDYAVLVIKSTVPVGTNQRVHDIVANHTDVDFDVVSNPEFLKEGAAVSDFLKPDRVVLGLDSDRALKVMRHIYAPFMHREDRLLVMDPASAELTKYACNAMLAARISFMNELSRLCDYFHADIGKIRHGMGTDRRIGPDFLYASLGYGGSCFPKDVRALLTMGRMANLPMRMIESTSLVNNEQRERVVRTILRHFGDNVQGRRIAVWGLAFKARTDDTRESAAITVAQRLVGAGASVAVTDPKALETGRDALGDAVDYHEDMYEACRDAEALVIATEWQEYRLPDLDRLGELMKDKVIFDGRNLYKLDFFDGTGFTYISIGRPAVEA